MQVGPHICLFKTHVDIFDHWDASVADKLRQLADKHGEQMCLSLFNVAVCALTCISLVAHSHSEPDKLHAVIWTSHC